MSTSAASNKPTRVRRCVECGNDMPIARTSCPHCGRPQFFPNVDLAKDPVEKQKLDARFQSAMSDCKLRGCEAIADKFTAACTHAVAVFACKLLKLHREIATGTQLWETYHDLERLRLQAATPGDFDWAKLRPQAEIELLGSHEHLDKIHYACLSIGGDGLSSYGECVVQLADPMIAHRASCFEGNTAVIYGIEHDFSRFLRCEWDDRNIMCSAVFSEQIDPSTNESDFSGILIQVAASSEDDRFIEVHIFGPMTAKSFQSVRVDITDLSEDEKVLLDAIKQKLIGVHIEEVTS